MSPETFKKLKITNAERLTSNSATISFRKQQSRNEWFTHQSLFSHRADRSRFPKHSARLARDKKPQPQRVNSKQNFIPRALLVPLETRNAARIRIPAHGRASSIECSFIARKEKKEKDGKRERGVERGKQNKKKTLSNVQRLGIERGPHYFSIEYWWLARRLARAHV